MKGIEDQFPQTSGPDSSRCVEVQGSKCGEVRESTKKIIYKGRSSRNADKTSDSRPRSLFGASSGARAHVQCAPLLSVMPGPQWLGVLPSTLVSDLARVLRLQYCLRPVTFLWVPCVLFPVPVFDPQHATGCKHRCSLCSECCCCLFVHCIVGGVCLSQSYFGSSHCF